MTMIAKKILHWYDYNKRSLPWRNKCSLKKKEFNTLVSEFMLQQTQVTTVIPYFNNFLKNIPNFKSLAKVSEKKLLKNWQGLGYYSRVKNLKESAKIILKDHNGRLPKNFIQLKNLPGIGDYTASAILAIVFNQPIIPLDGNVERVLKRILNLKTEKQLNKKSLDEKKKVFGSSNRSNDYAEALMELGALICRPKNPYCEKCPITKDCMSYKNKDFKIKKRKKIIINKFYAVTLYINKGQILLIKNEKFKFLKNLLIFPMKETSKSNFLLKNNKLNLKMSNLNMNISIDLIKTKKKNKKDLWIAKENLKNYMLPNFTKKIFSSIEGLL